MTLFRALETLESDWKSLTVTPKTSNVIRLVKLGIFKIIAKINKVNIVGS